MAATDFFVGASVTLFSRQFKITAFADPATERRLKLARSSTLAIITSDALQHIGSILSAAGEGGLTVGRASMLSLSSEQASDLVANRTPTGSLPLLFLFMSCAAGVSVWTFGCLQTNERLPRS